MAKVQPVVLEGVEMRFRNFEGRADQYNDEGNREFVVILPEDAAKDMADNGWNVKILENKHRDEDDEATPAPEGSPIVRVKVSYKFRAPNIFIITSRGMTKLGENEIAMLDWADIAYDAETNAPLVDMILSGSAWEVNNKSGVKAYLQSLYVTIQEDPLQLKYGDLMLLGESQATTDGPPELS